MNTVNTFVDNLNAAVINPLIQLLIGLAAVVFLWGVFEYLLNGDNPDKRNQGTRHILWGLIGLVIMFSVQGILALLESLIQ